MELWKTDRTDLTTDEIEGYIQRHQSEIVPRLNRMAAYYEAKNPTILGRKPGDPDNRTPFGYGRKIITTFAGYAYRPGYITYRPDERRSDVYVEALKDLFLANSETVKTSRTGKNTGIFGSAYEMHYVDSQGAPRFFNSDPRSTILIYDTQSEPGKAIGIRYYKGNSDASETWNVELYLRGSHRTYSRASSGGGKWEYTLISEGVNFYGSIPISPYYMGDDRIGLIEPVAPIIDDYDILVSDSMVEFQRFANAYLRIVGATLGDPTGQNPKLVKQMLSRLKQTRIFDQLKSADDVTFLTKDIPKDFIDFMTTMLREQIHAQSHVPDFNSDAFRGQISGAAIERMLFDFENVVSSAEADFDIGLRDRIDLMSTIMAATGGPKGDSSKVVISHRRNIPVDELDSATVAVALRNAGISMRTTLDSMPRDIVPNVEEEIARQGDESRMPDLDMVPDETGQA